MVRPSPSTRKRIGRAVRGRAPAPEGVAAARRALQRRRLEGAILAAAAEVFATEDPRPRALDEVAHRAKTEPSVVLGLFTSVDRLFAAVLLAHVDALDERTRKAVRHAGSAREQLETIVAVRAVAALEHPRFTRLLAPGAQPPPEVMRGYARLRSRVRAAFAEGIRTGEVRKDGPDANVLAAMFDGGMRTWLAEKVARPGVAPDEAAVRALVGVMLDGVAAPRRGRRRSR